jgi:uncharacterized membrane protein
MTDRPGNNDIFWGEDISPVRVAIDRFLCTVTGKSADWLLRHWLLVANLSNAATAIGALLSPFLIAQGFTGLGRAIFTIYHLICAQNPGRSYFLFGYQMALDQRMIAIYVAATAAGLAYVPLRARFKPLPWRIYLMLIAPMAIDGFTQLFGWRQSSWQLRTATGGLFGIASVLWLYLHLDSALGRLATIGEIPGRGPVASPASVSAHSIGDM